LLAVVLVHAFSALAVLVRVPRVCVRFAPGALALASSCDP